MTDQADLAFDSMIAIYDASREIALAGNVPLSSAAVILSW